MPIDEMFQDGTDQVLNDRVARPLAERPTSRSFGASVWGVSSALPKGVAAGANEGAGFFSDVMGAYSSVMAATAYQTDPTLMFDKKERERIKAAGSDAREAVRTGAAFSTEAGDNFRSTAREFMPNPETANQAEQLLFGLGRFGVKAVTYAAAGGAVPGAIAVGVDEAMTEADRLKREGVDLDTRVKVGAVAGLVAGASVALPIAGRTLGQTAGLVAVGGPGGFIAQQAASKAILENADYSRLADQYDPFDPVGLAVSTLIPAAFGAYAMRGARNAAPAPKNPAAERTLAQMGGNELRALKYDDARLDAYAVTAAQREGIPPEALLAIKNVGERSGSTAVSPKGAKGVMQFMGETWAAFGKGDPRDPTASIDAGAKYMKNLIEQYGGDVRAAIAHYNGGGKAGKAVQRGDYAPARETREYLKRTEEYMAQRRGDEAGRAAANDPEAVAAARVQQVRDVVESWNMRDPADATAARQHLEAVLRASDQIGAGQRVSVTEIVPFDKTAQAKLLDDLAGRMESARAELLPAAGELFDPGMAAPIRAEISALEQSRPVLDDASLRASAKEIQAREGTSYKQALSQAKREGATALRDIEGQIGRLREQLDAHRGAAETQKQIAVLDREIANVRAGRSPESLPAMRPGAQAIKQAMGEAGKANPVIGETAPAAPAPKASAPVAPASADASPTATPSASPIAASIEAQAGELARLAPDMLVQLEGMDAPMRLADALEAVKADAIREKADAPLLEVAAQCALQNA